MVKGSTQEIVVGTTTHTVRISGITQNEIARAVHFHQADLAAIVGFSTTSILLDLPEGMQVDTELGSVSNAIVIRQDTVDSFNSLQDQQKKAYSAIMFLGILIAVVVLFNTLLMNLAERDAELATLRVLELPLADWARCLIEHLFIGLVGGIWAA